MGKARFASSETLDAAPQRFEILGDHWRTRANRSCRAGSQEAPSNKCVIGRYRRTPVVSEGQPGVSCL
jgi:hypothetical protein